MSTHEPEGKSASHAQPADTQSADGAAAPSKANRMRMMLKIVARYTVLGLAPLIAVAALAVAIIAFKSNHANIAKMTQNAEKIEALNATLLATKNDLESLKFSALKAKNQQSEALATQEERLTKIIQNITPMQIKMRISPTLEQQLSLPASAPVATPHEAVPAALTPHKTSPHAAAPAAPVPHEASTHTTATPHAAEKAAAPAATPTASKKVETKVSPQVRAMRDAIEQYNKKN